MIYQENRHTEPMSTLFLHVSMDTVFRFFCSFLYFRLHQKLILYIQNFNMGWRRGFLSRWYPSSFWTILSRKKMHLPMGSVLGFALAKSIFELQNGNITARNLPDGGACLRTRITVTKMSFFFVILKSNREFSYNGKEHLAWKF